MRTESKDLSAANFKYPLFTKDEKPVNLLNLQNLLTYENSYKGKMMMIRFQTSGFNGGCGGFAALYTSRRF